MVSGRRASRSRYMATNFVYEKSFVYVFVREHAALGGFQDRRRNS